MADSGGLPEEPQPTLSPGTRLGKYEIARLLGAGGMGAVYEAAHMEIGKRVAIKVLSPAISAVPGARTRFLREAQLTSRVRHPNIVDVTDMGSEGGQTYLVMELLRGEDLAQRLVRTGPLAAQDLADILLPVCSAVVEAHQAGVTHRDLKPQNIFLAAGPHTIQPKVLDFGISKANDVAGAGTLTGTGAMIGTPFYLAPEQIMDTRSAGPQSDQYALGVIMYECLTGTRPYEAENLFVVFQSIVAGKAIAPRQRRPEIPSHLEEIVLRAMHVDPKARFGSTRELGRALLPFASARVRSIWEDVFTIPGEAPAPSPVETPVVSLAGGTKVLTPAADDPASWDRLRRSAGKSAGKSAGLSAGTERVAAAEVPPAEDAADTLDIFARVTARSRHFRLAAVVGGVAVLGLIITLAATGGSSDPDPRFKKRSQASPVAPPDPDPEPVARTPPPRPLPPPARPEPTFQVKVDVEPAHAAFELDGKLAGVRHLERTLPLDGARHRLLVAASGFEQQVVEFVDEPPPEKITWARVRRAPRVDVAAPESPDSDGSSGRPTSRRPVAAPPRREVMPSLNPNGAPVID
ncbi:MAG: serine/threonine-protein kinase [Pseudomonadota bacterium]